MITLIIIIGFIFVGPVLGVLLTMSFYSGDLVQDIESATPKAGLVTALFVMQSTATLVGLILIPLIYITKVEHKSLRPLFPAQENLGSILIVVAAIGLIFPVAMSPLAEWNMNLTFPDFMSGFEDWAKLEEERLAKLTGLLTNIDSVGKLFAALLVIGLLPAIGEELVFRGMIQQELWRGSHKIHFAIWTSAFIFSAIHMQFYGFIPRLLLGALFGYLYYWSGNLLIPIFSHFFNNGFAVVMVYLHRTSVTSIDVENGEAVPLKYVLPCIVLTIALLYYARKHYLTPGYSGKTSL
ncbi:MAG TPA: CPBP family intramembrane glutamic endopeptidase [Chryseolinea sp.]|nr:CPBP family intramembrane glutamic endopeptidase [Chryseolinea sp.]